MYDHKARLANLSHPSHTYTHTHIPTYPAVVRFPRRINPLAINRFQRNRARKDISQIGNVAAENVLVEGRVDVVARGGAKSASRGRAAWRGSDVYMCACQIGREEWGCVDCGVCMCV